MRRLVYLLPVLAFAALIGWFWLGLGVLCGPSLAAAARLVGMHCCLGLGLCGRPRVKASGKCYFPCVRGVLGLMRMSYLGSVGDRSSRAS